MAVVAFDTHPHIKSLTSAGFSEAQAEAMASLVTSSRQADTSELATKADLAVVRAGLGAEFTSTKSDLETRISKSEADIIKWVAGLIGFQTLAILGAVVALVRFLRP